MKALELAPIVRLRGTDAIVFAQTQFSADIAALAERRWQWNAWLDAQGRARQFFALLRTGEEELLAWLPLGDADTMRADLQRYVFRAKVVVECIADWALHADASAASPLSGELAALGNGYALALPGSPARTAVLAPRAGPALDAAALDAWRRADIEAGLPWIATPLAGAYVAPALGLQRMAAISLDKGCYPGQEIVARLHYRGGNKRELFRVYTSMQTAPLPGSDIVQHDAASSGAAKSLGRVLYSASTPDPHGGHVALAVLPGDCDATQLVIAGGAPIDACQRVGND